MMGNIALTLTYPMTCTGKENTFTPICVSGKTVTKTEKETLERLLVVAIL